MIIDFNRSRRWKILRDDNKLNGVLWHENYIISKMCKINPKSTWHKITANDSKLFALN